MSPRPYALVVLGGSAGALTALEPVLGALGPEFPLPVAATLHVLPGSPSLLVEVVSRRCALRVREADDKLPLEPGTLTFAPPDYHLLVESDLRASLSLDAREHFCRPSIDVLFGSAAASLGPRVVAVLLSGANADGARGLAAVRAAGGLALAQDPATCACPEMPLAAVALGAPERVLSPSALGAALRALHDVPEGHAP